ncbi:fatty-acyl-CoA synthase [Oceanospirillum multiglobuliferum]|uniref:Long-chain fatty acid--CoA ligase n=1 Tax=Oceanospirillum multiglobuliferum TaxID=64969 RepID=A0A1T4KVN6_9GAMM|nr:fatty acid--CoA ligase [Oceanospirillum multiglobuliferum]OPX54968.1 long-chain fatty acid--CoA ligase [Oceanospirillum multiglobuliferum]SJZ46471.1 fatty-acyl-CoA synthase [Oceanospirillum multiglobuliferum]
MPTKILPSADAAQAYPLLIKQIFASAGRFEPNNQIIYRGEQSFSYQQFRDRVQQLANAMTAAGVQAGDTVAVMDWDSHRYLECYFAIPMLGAVLHHVNIRLSPEQIAYTMNHAEDKVVLVHDDFVPLIEQIQNHLSTVEGYIRLSDGQPSVSQKVEFIGEYEALLAAESPVCAFPDFDENSIATTFYTTGTTGNPKGVFFSHRQLVLHTLNMMGMLGSYDGLPLLRSDSVYMPITPMFHVHAWGVPYVAVMLNVTQVYPGRYEPDKLVGLIRDYKVTISHCVPTILQMLLSCETGQKTRLDNWKVLIGGSALPMGLALAATEKGADIYSAYGMSETCPLLTITHLNKEIRALPIEEQLKYRTLTGVASNMVDLTITEPDGQLADHDGTAVGEITVQAPWLTQGYFKELQKQEELWEGGRLHTGDVACIHPDGFIEIKDRIKDVIKTGGEWVSSIELENLISQHPAVAAVAVVGVPDTEWGERPYAMVVPKTSEVDAAQIKQHLQQFVSSGQITKWSIPEHIDLVDDIPKTSVGKINKKAIREQLQA